MNNYMNNKPLKSPQLRQKALGFPQSHLAQGQKGVGLIEVLIAMLVLATGILGMAGLQLTSKRTSFEAVQRVTAMQLARDMIERIRVNPSVLSSYSGTAIITIPAVPSTICKGATICSNTQLATYDIFQWGEMLLGAADTTAGGVNAGGLVTPTGCITVAGNIVEVAIAWRGYIAISNPSGTGISTCGENSGLYDDASLTDDEYRQIITVNAYVSEYL